MSVVEVNTLADIDWDRVTIADGYLFGTIMKNEKIYIPMIERLLGIKNISKIKQLQNEKTEKPGYLSKGIRLDIYAEGEAGAFFNLEMQSKDTKELPQRARYYHSVMDTTYFKAGNNYADIRNNYVVFICRADIFGLGCYCYKVKSTIAENQGYDNGSHTIFFNTKGYRGKISSESKAILDFVEGIVSDDPFVQELALEVEKIKNNEKWRETYMTQYLYQQDAKREGRAEGRAEGRIEGRIDGMLEVAKSALANNLSIELISRITGLSLDDISSMETG